MKKIVIIWWSSGFGYWLAGYIWKKFQKEVDIKITWVNKEKLSLAAKKIGVTYSTDNIESVRDADIVVFSVPISYTNDIIKEVIPHVKNGSVVLDVTSIKNEPAKAMLENAPEWVLVIPTHPMFWPYISSIASQIIVLTPEEKVKIDYRYVYLKDFLENSWATVIESSPLEHDKMMAVVQWLTHFNMFVIWETINRLSFDIKKSMNFVSPIYKMLISMVSRYVWHNPKLYGDIQINNKEVLEVNNIFMEVTNDFNSFIKSKDEVSFISTIKQTKDFFWDNTDLWQKYTDKIIYLISKQKQILIENIWNKLNFENIYSKEKVSAKLKKIDWNNVYLESWKILNIDEWFVIN